MTNMRAKAGPLMLLAAGFGLWAVAFTILYAMLSVGCAAGWDQTELLTGFTLQRMQLVVLAMAFFAAHIFLIWRLKTAAISSEKGPTRFIHRIAFASATAALVASVATFAGVFGLTSCLPPV